jgi:hypothetical protein
MARKDYYRMTRMEDPMDTTAMTLASERDAFALLRDGVPLSLLLDLALPVHSEDLLREEPADTSWVPRPRAVA